MKSFALIFLMIGIFNSALADSAPDRALVEKYMKASNSQENNSALIDSYIRQYGANADSEKKEQLRKYFNQAMGWEVMKEQYASIIAETYTANELKSLIAFLSMPLGKSAGEKYHIYSDKVVAVVARNMMQPSKQQVDMVDSDGEIQTGSELSDISTTDVEEHNLNGQTYFVGIVHNNGKRKVHGVQVEVDLFESGKFVDQYSTYLTGSIAPGTTRYFKIGCGCKDSQPASHDSYKIQIFNGY